MKNRILAILDTKSKKIVAIVLIIAILGITVFGVYAMLQKDVKLALKNETFTSEYGEVISLEAKDYLDLNKLSEKEKEDVLKNIKVEAPGIVKEEGKEYPVLGQTMLTLIYKEEKINAKVFVNDTKAPVFNEITEVTFEQGTEFDYANSIVATDLQEVEVTFDSTAVNKDAPGDYIIKATAKDKSGNEATKDIKVVVTAKSVVEETPATNNGVSNGSTTRPNSSGGNSSKPSTGGSSSSAGNGSNTGGTTTPPTKPETPHVHNGTPIEGMLFNSGGELDAWAGEYIERVYDKTPYSTWGSRQCTCGKWYITYFK